MPDHEESESRVELWAQFAKEASGKTGTVPLPWGKLSYFSQALRPKCGCLVAGPQNTGKSFFATHIALGVHRQCDSWCYLPLEGDKQEFMRRILAILVNDYRIIDNDSAGSEWRMDMLKKHADEYDQIQRHVYENPRKPRRGYDGEVVVPQFSHHEALGFLKEKIANTRVVIIDPVTQIDFNGPNQWQVENDFIRKALGLVAEYDNTWVMVTHTKDRSGMKGKIPLTIEDIQGSTLWRKLVQTVIMIDAHDMKDGEVHKTSEFTGDVDTEEIEYNRTVMLCRTRHGRGSRCRFAFMQDLYKPVFEELGMLAQKKRKTDND